MRISTVAAAAFLAAGLTVGSASASEPIEGTWLRPSTGTIVMYSGGGGKYCGTVQNGEHKGKSIGCMSGKGGSYTGEVIDIGAGKTYKGTAKVSGSGMDLKGCVAMVLCKGETWKRQ